jgi:hypothetical protein
VRRVCSAGAEEERAVRKLMDVRKIIDELRAEQALIEEAIIALERLRGKRRGRRPAWMRVADARARSKRSKS